jgi:hypothetical protein
VDVDVDVVVVVVVAVVGENLLPLAISLGYIMPQRG